MDAEDYLEVPIECLTVAEICDLIRLLDEALEARADEHDLT